ncbi:cysteine-rich secretory protein family domain-containing protein [Ditylenchus destructor]|uniref:Cysteine-rich secretory protein family domain-containing protein n=1 Tax=Ditylenchus destructor TaxID=166010 RepID=A0AAD4MS58_9BILA|nr:cysteine-rich secretory protein family domain-containing protein [Ditylenchus destructor]
MISRLPSTLSAMPRLPALLTTPLLILISTLISSMGAFTVDNLAASARVSHSGPTNALYGHETLADESTDRSKRGVFWPNWGFNQNNNGFGGLLVASEPPNNYLKMWITSEHNQYRKMVPATDMRMVYWSDELAASAQRHADTCDFRHSRNRINIGENIWAAPYTNYSDAVSRWFNEVNNPRCACNHAYKHCCGHYIQVVWAQTNLVGCGYARCRDVLGVLGMGMRATFVCHYNPQGNKVYFGNPSQPYAVPAFTWANSNAQRCSQCPPDAPSCHEGLCYMPLGQKQSNGTNSAVQTPATPVPGYLNAQKCYIFCPFE